ncbi:hypothetical protein AB0L62_12840 [Nocardia asteroides]|uniref:hypothetical protein n=1 Tax=Nocardia asteroides TaxID=1824 RepID=UPI00343810FF
MAASMLGCSSPERAPGFVLDSLREVEQFPRTQPLSTQPRDAARACVFDAVRSVLIAMADSPTGGVTDTTLVHSPEQSVAVRKTDGRDRLELEIHVNTRSAPSFSMRGDLVGGGDPETVIGKLRAGRIADFPPDVVDGIALFALGQNADIAGPTDVTSQKDADSMCALAYGSPSEEYPYTGGFIDFVRATYGLDRTGLPAEDPTFNCPGTVTDYRDVDHPTLGQLRISLVGSRSNTRMPDGNACIAITNSDGVEVTTIPMSAYDGTLYFSPTPVDTTGNLFVVYNPGRYDGVLVIVPSDKGVSSVDRYNARLIGPGANGQFTIEFKNHDCTPDCAHGPTTTQIQHWDGTDYVP